MFSTSIAPHRAAVVREKRSTCCCPPEECSLGRGRFTLLLGSSSELLDGLGQDAGSQEEIQGCVGHRSDEPRGFEPHRRAGLQTEGRELWCDATASASPKLGAKRPDGVQMPTQGRTAFLLSLVPRRDKGCTSSSRAGVAAGLTGAGGLKWLGIFL